MIVWFCQPFTVRILSAEFPLELLQAIEQHRIHFDSPLQEPKRILPPTQPHSLNRPPQPPHEPSPRLRPVLGRNDAQYEVARGQIHVHAGPPRQHLHVRLELLGHPRRDPVLLLRRHEKKDQLERLSGGPDVRAGMAPEGPRLDAALHPELLRVAGHLGGLRPLLPVAVENSPHLAETSGRCCDSDGNVVTGGFCQLIHQALVEKSRRSENLVDAIAGKLIEK